jgi:hypothetical protein
VERGGRQGEREEGGGGHDLGEGKVVACGMNGTDGCLRGGRSYGEKRLMSRAGTHLGLKLLVYEALSYYCMSPAGGCGACLAQAHSHAYTYAYTCVLTLMHLCCTREATSI